jgi:cytochrome c
MWPRLAAILIFLGLLLLAGCSRYQNYVAYSNPEGVTNGGDPQAGKDAIRNYGCNTCHTIPGVRDAVGVVGPSLGHWANRNLIAGRLPNTPDNLVHWIQRPRETDPHTAMPQMNVTDDDARNIAAYLYSLK